MDILVSQWERGCDENSILVNYKDSHEDEFLFQGWGWNS